MSDLLGDAPEPERHVTLCLACGSFSIGADSMAKPCSRCGAHRKRPATPEEVQACIDEAVADYSPGFLDVMRAVDLAVLQETPVDSVRGIQKILDPLAADLLVRAGLLARTQALPPQERVLVGAKAIAAAFCFRPNDGGDGEEPEPEPEPEPEERRTPA